MLTGMRPWLELEDEGGDEGSQMDEVWEVDLSD